MGLEVWEQTRQQIRLDSLKTRKGRNFAADTVSHSIHHDVRVARVVNVEIDASVAAAALFGLDTGTNHGQPSNLIGCERPTDRFLTVPVVCTGRIAGSSFLERSLVTRFVSSFCHQNHTFDDARNLVVLTVAPAI